VTASLAPGLALLPAALAAPLFVLARRRPFLRESSSVLAALAQTAIVASMIPAVLGGATLEWRPMPLAAGVPLSLRADALGLLFATLASALWTLTTFYSIGYVRSLREHAQTRYFACFALCLFATVGIAFAGNLLTFFCFFELLSVVSYPLVIHKETPEALRAGRIYLAYTLGGGAALLAAVAVLQSVAGSTDFVPGGLLSGSGGTPLVLWGLLALCVVGCGVKAALMPLHTWLPVAMVAPTPVSALLHAVAVVKAGVFGVARISGFVFGLDLLREMHATTLLSLLAAVTIVLGSLAALAQTNLKRLLAFSTVSQLSYVILGVTLGTPAAYAAGLLHMASHALLKITLFFCAGAVYVAAHAEDVSELDGMGRRMPWTMGAFAVAGVLLAGLPPGLAFVSKWRLANAAADVGAWTALAALGASTVLTLAYIAPIAVRAFLRPAAGHRAEAPRLVLVPLLVTAAAAALLGFFPSAGPGLLRLAELAAANAAGQP
jgi:multicomponent Na+:H+ antiporter subunit D